MNTRRTFFKQLAGVAAGFAILPAATTYDRIWKPKTIVPVYGINPEWVSAPYEIKWLTDGAMPVFSQTKMAEYIVPAHWEKLQSPVRFISGCNGEMILIPKFIQTNA